MDLQIKKKRKTDKEHAHVDVYNGDKYLGYYMKDDMARVFKWVFSPEPSNSLRYFCTEKQVNILDKIIDQLEENEIDLQQHFGIIETLNKKS